MTVGSLELSANKDIQQLIEIVEDFGKYKVLAKHLQVHRQLVFHMLYPKYAYMYHVHIIYHLPQYDVTRIVAEIL